MMNRECPWFKGFLADLGLDALLSVRFPQPGILGLEHLHTLREGRVRAAALALPLVDHGRAAAMLPGQVRYGDPGLVLLQDGHNLAVGES